MSSITVLVAAVIEQRGRILMVKEGGEKDKNYGRWNIPTGHLEENEDIVSGCRREVKEETGFDVDISSMVGIYQYQKNDKTKLRIIFEGKVDSRSGEPGPDILEVRWFTATEIHGMTQEEIANPLIRNIVSDYLDGSRYNLDVINNFMEDRK